MITLVPFIKSFMVSFNPSPELDLVGYRTHAVHKGALVNGDFTPTDSNIVNHGPDTSFTVPVNQGGTWYVKVAAYDSFGEDVLNYSSLISVDVPTTDPLDVVPPGVPYNVSTTIAVIGSGVFVHAEATLHWVMGSIPEDFSNFLVRYRHTTGSNDAPWQEKFLFDKDATSFLLTPLDINVQYDVQIAAVDRWANQSAWSTLLVVDTTTSAYVVPVSGLSFTTALNSVTAVWNASSHPQFSNYKIDLSTSKDFTTGVTSSISTAPRFTFNGSNGVVYYVRVKVVTYQGTESDWCTPANITTFDTLAANKISTGMLSASTVISVGSNNLVLDGTNSRVSVSDGNVTDRVQIGKLGTGDYGIDVKNAAGTSVFKVSNAAGAVLQNATVGNLVVGAAGILCGTGGSAFKVWDAGSNNMRMFIGDYNTTQSNFLYWDGTTLSIKGNIVLGPSSTITWAQVASGGGRPADNATVGAQAGVNLKDSTGTTLADAAIKNANINIGSNGVLSGAGGGQVTIGGLGFTGALNANYINPTYIDSYGIYSGTIIAENMIGTTITGKTIQTASTGQRVIVDSASKIMAFYGDDGWGGGLQLAASIALGDRLLQGTINAGGDNWWNIAVKGQSFLAGVWGHGNGNGVGVWGTSSTGRGVLASGGAGSYDFYADGAGANYGPFTGAHDGLMDKCIEVEFGDIVIDVNILNKANLSNCITRIFPSSLPKDRRVVGIMINRMELSDENIPSALKDRTYSVGIPLDAVYGFKQAYDLIQVNALGEGQVNVCKDGGNILVGDYICSSSRRGKGMKQDDDLLHNYTVAKAREDVIWAENEDDIRMVACTYHCG